MVLIIISGNKSEIKQFYTSNPVTLDRNSDYVIALTQCTLWYSRYNISDQFKNNTFEYREKIKMNGLTLLYSMCCMMKRV